MEMSLHCSNAMQCNAMYTHIHIYINTHTHTTVHSRVTGTG